MGSHHAGDAENGGFGFPRQVMDQKPGIDRADLDREADSDGDDGFRARDQKDVPQASLAERIERSARGE